MNRIRPVLIPPSSFLIDQAAAFAEGEDARSGVAQPGEQPPVLCKPMPR